MKRKQKINKATVSEKKMELQNDLRCCKITAIFIKNKYAATYSR